MQGTLPHRGWATDLETAGVRDTFTQLQQDQLVAVATDGLDKRDHTEQQQVVAEVTNLMAAQVAETVKKAEEVQTQAAVDVVASALAGTQAAAALAADAAAAGVGVGQGIGFVGGGDAAAFGGAGGFAGGGGVAGMGAGLGVGPGFTVLDKKVLAYMMDKDPDRYDDYLALQHNKSTEIAGHKVVFPVEEDSETNFPLRFSAHKVRGWEVQRALDCSRRSGGRRWSAAGSWAGRRAKVGRAGEQPLVQGSKWLAQSALFLHAAGSQASSAHDPPVCACTTASCAHHLDFCPGLFIGLPAAALGLGEGAGIGCVPTTRARVFLWKEAGAPRQEATLLPSLAPAVHRHSV